MDCIDSINVSFTFPMHSPFIPDTYIPVTSAYSAEIYCPFHSSLANNLKIEITLN